jgi:Cu(I)/Ag(I) efflux system membrane fusion protein
MKKTIRYSFIFLVVTSLFFSCGNREHAEHAEHVDVKEELYTCPMHPEIIRNAPGSCPVCGMALVKKQPGDKSVEDIQLDALLKPVNEFVVSAVPVTTIERREEDLKLNVVGIVTHDTRQAATISSRVNGRIEKLYIRYKYQPVRKGQRIMDIYSPELLTAQQNLIFLLRNDKDNISLVNAAKDKLFLMGMTSGEVAELVKTKVPRYSIGVFSNYSGFVTDLNTSAGSRAVEEMQAQMSTNQELEIKEGMYVKMGQFLFSVYNPAKSWILLDIFPDQQNLVKAGSLVRIVPETAPQQSITAKINYIEPAFRPGKKTLSARVYLNNANMQLPIGSRVTATIFGSSANASWLPKDAVLSLGRDKVVFVKQSGGFKAHKVTTGLELNRSIEVVTGLSSEDSVASNAQFLVDNEAFIKVSDQ